MTAESQRQQRGGFADRADRRPDGRPGARARRRAVRHQGAESVRQQGAAAHRRCRTRPRPSATATGTRTRRWPARTRRRPAPPARPGRRPPPTAAVATARRRRPHPAAGAAHAPSRRPTAGDQPARPAGRASQPLSTETGRRSVHLLRAGRRLCAHRGRRAAARAAGDARLRGQLTERDQSGRTVYRVRLGPFEHKEEADAAKEKLDGAGVDSALVRVQK